MNSDFATWGGHTRIELRLHQNLKDADGVEMFVFETQQYMLDLLKSYLDYDHGWHLRLFIFHEIISDNIIFSTRKTLPRDDRPYERISPCFWWAQLLYALDPDEASNFLEEEQKQNAQSNEGVRQDEPQEHTDIIEKEHIDIIEEPIIKPEVIKKKKRKRPEPISNYLINPITNQHIHKKQIFDHFMKLF